MSDCEFNAELRCVHCGYQARKPGTRRNCGIPHAPPLATQLRGYAAALARWIEAGSPTRSDDDVAERLGICESNACGQYADGQCLACGCRVNASGIAVANKLRMATENCPRGFWA
jgi:hypothetical protein